MKNKDKKNNNPEENKKTNKKNLNSEKDNNKTKKVNKKLDNNKSKQEIKQNSEKENKKEKKQVVEDKIEINNEEKSLEKLKREKPWVRFIRTIKQKWLISRINTILLVVVLIGLCVFLNAVIRNAGFSPIDLSINKNYSLTKESKERVSKVDKDVNIYFVGWNEENQDYILAKQYTNANSKIKVQLIDATKDIAIAKKYEVENEEMAIIVECGKTSRKLYQSEIVTYDAEYNTVDLIEQKLTSAILNVTAEKIPKVYYLNGYSSYNFKKGLIAFSKYLDDEVLTYDELNILNTGKVPEDCDTLIIMTPEKDFDNSATNAILEYIKKGGNILWFNGIYTTKLKLPNVDKILAEYGINSFDVGIAYEKNPYNTILGYSTCFIPEIQQADVTKTLYDAMGVVFFAANKINVNTDKLEQLKVEKQDLIMSSETTYFAKDLNNLSSKDNEKGAFLLGAEMTKTIDDKIKSKLIIYGNDAFITDLPVVDQSGKETYIIEVYNNANLALNSIAYLTNNDQEITIRKNYYFSKSDFTPSDGQRIVIMIIIFAVPIIIILVGIVIWTIRKRRQ